MKSFKPNPIPSLADAPTFAVYVNRVKRAVARDNLGPPDAVGDGLTIGGFGRPGLDALKATPVEMWQEADLAECWSFAEAACKKSNAEALNLRFEEYPVPLYALFSELVKQGAVSRQWEQLPPARANHLEGAFSAEAGSDGAAAGALLEQLAALKEDVDPGASSEGAAAKLAAVARLEAQLEKAQTARTPAAGPKTGGGQYTVPPRQAPAPKPPAPSSKAVADAAQVQALQIEAAGFFFAHREENARTIATLNGSLPSASIDFFPPVVIGDLLRRAKHQEALRRMVGASLAAVGTPTASAALASITGTASDATFQRLIARAGSGLKISPVDRLLGSVPVGDLSLLVARSVHVPRSSRDWRALNKAIESVKFLDETGALDVAGASHTLLQAMSKSGEDEGENYDKPARALVAGLAVASHVFFKATFPGREGEQDWQSFALGWVKKLVDNGARQFTSEDYGELTGTLFEFGREQGNRLVSVQAASGDKEEYRPSVLRFEDHTWDESESDDARGEGGWEWGARDYEPAVLAAFHPPGGGGAQDSVGCAQCGKVVRGYAVCSGCGLARDSWICPTCGMLTLAEQAFCANNRTGGCPGTRAEGRAPTRGEIESISRRVVQARAGDPAPRQDARAGKGNFGGGDPAPRQDARAGKGNFGGGGKGRGGGGAGRGGGGPGGGRGDGRGGGLAPRVLLTNGPVHMHDIRAAYYHGHQGDFYPRDGAQGHLYPGSDPRYGGRGAGYGGGN